MQKRKRAFNAFLVFLFAIVLWVTSYGGTDIKIIPSINENNILQCEDGRKVVVAVIDTGLNIDKIIDESRIIHIEGNNTDEIGHGTKIVQLIQNNTSDMVSIMPIKVVDSNGSASIEKVCKGIKKAVDNGADIVNLSMNTIFYTDSTELEELITELYKKGILVIVSAGNEKEDTKYLAPANIDKAIVVSAMTDSKEPYFYSNYGESVDLSALGLYDGNLGTSFASAYVTSYCANLMAEGCENIESEVSEDLKQISEKEYGEGYLKWEGQYVGKTNKEKEDGIYLGKRDKTLNEKTCNILEIDWRGLSTEELDGVIGETDYKYVGLLLSRMNESDLEAILEKSYILNTNVNRLDTEYDETTSDYVVTNKTEVGYVEYCLGEYEKEKEKMLLTSDWDCRTEEAVMYISSPDRQKIYKYTITGLYGKAWVQDSFWKPAFETRHLSITSSIYRDGDTSYQFTMPTPVRISAFIPSVRATKNDFYSTDGTFLHTSYSWNYIGEGVDDAKPYVGISVEFNNYSNKKQGYHNSENSIIMYNAELGVGSSTQEALSYMYDYGFKVLPEKNNIHFNTTTLGYVEYYFNGVFKDGYNMYNATTLEESLSSWDSGYKDNIYISTGQSSINDTSGTFTLNIIPPIGLGTRWYMTYNNELMADSDIPEVVFNLSPNTYTVNFNGNGATGGWMGDIPMTYNAGRNLFGNGFVRTGYTFTGWNTRPDGTGTGFSDGQWVNNLTDAHNAVVTLYAQWTPNRYNMTLNHMGGTYNGAGENTYPVICQSYDYCDVSWGVPTREGYTFDGFWSQPEGGTQVYDRAGHCINGTLYWNNGWQYRGDVTFYAHWIPHTYKICFDANGGEGSMADIEAVYDVPVLLPENSFTRANEYGQSVFRGWSTDAGASEPVYEDGAEVRNLTTEAGGLVVLYAIWDDCPWIVAEDLYYTLEEAQSGRITYEELMSHAAAEDREAGGPVLPGTDAEKGTSFTIIDYAETDFTQFTHEGSVTETYRVVDSIGNSYKKMITVFITDTAPEYLKPEGSTRFISEKYYYEPYERGGLEEDSIWKTNPEYVQVIKQAFENSRNNTPLMSFHFTHEEVLQMKEFVETNGIGNFNSSDALQRFYEQFMGDSKK